jgi:hypothetical protein
MSKLTLLAAAMALAGFAQAHAQSAAEDKGMAQSIADCNVIADPSAAKRKNMRACETLAMEGRLSLVEPAAQAAYQQYREEQRQACLRRQASPRGQSRGQSSCGS